MKLTGYLKGRGKLGNMVVSQVGGYSIARDYRAKIANPNTEEQVGQRARFKLLSQLAASMAPVIAIAKDGLKSSRNQFVSRNFALSFANDGAAAITIENLQLTKGTSGLPAIVATRSAATDPISVKLAESASIAADRICYCMFSKTAENKMQLMTSIVVADTAGNGLFEAELPAMTTDAVIYAYGMKDLNASAAAKYGNYNVSSGEDIARLIMSRKLSTEDYKLSQTRGTQLLRGETSNGTPTGNESRLWLTESGPVTVSGAGVYPNGTLVQIQASVPEGKRFIGWRDNGTQQFIGYSPTLRIELNQNRDIVAVAYDPDSSTGGEASAPTSNPLPYASAEVILDSTQYYVTDGIIPDIESFDNLIINNVFGFSHVTYVPEGSYLGAADNVELLPSPENEADYMMEETNSRPGAIYLDDNVFFYIGSLPWVNPYPGTEISFDNMTYWNPISKPNINVQDSIIQYVALKGFTDSTLSIEIVKENGVIVAEIPYDDNGIYDSGEVNLYEPVDIFINGKKWIHLYSPDFSTP